MSAITASPSRPTPLAPSGRLSVLVLLLAVALTAVSALLVPSPALAHAQLLETTPFDGQRLEASPDEVTLRFNEGVTTVGGAVRVFDDAGERVDLGDAGSIPGDPASLRAGLPVDLGDGAYIVTWRATSADGHPIKGAFVYTVGDASQAEDDLVAALFSGGDNPVVGLATTALTAMTYLAVLAVFGMTVYLRRVSVREDGRARVRDAAAMAARLGIATAVFLLPLQAMVASGLLVGALAPSILGETLLSTTGQSIVVRVLALSVALVLLRPERMTDRRPAGLLIASSVALLAFLLDGHTRTQDPAAVIMAADAVHLVTTAIWVGGLGALLLDLRSMRRDRDPVGAAHLVANFSRLATVAVLLAVAAGVAQGWVTVRATRALTGTSYGTVLLIKTALVGALLAIGAYNNRSLVPAVVRAAVPAGGSADTSPATGTVAPDTADQPATHGDAAWARLARTVRLEVLGVAAVLLVTAGLVTLQPAAQEAGITGAFTTYVDLNDDLEINLVVDPNQAGFNQVHVYVLDRTGRPVSDVDEITFQFSLPARDIGPIEREPFVAGPGHWQVDGNQLSLPGQWIIRVEVGIGRFTLDSVEIPVTVNG